MLPSPDFNFALVLYPTNVPGWSLFYELLINVFYAAFWRRLSNIFLIWTTSIAAESLRGLERTVSKAADLRHARRQAAASVAIGETPITASSTASREVTRSEWCGVRHAPSLRSRSQSKVEADTRPLRSPASGCRVTPGGP